MRLRFQDAIEPSQLALHSTQALMQRIPARHALTSSFLYDDWRPDEITALLDLLTPRRAIVVHLSPQHAAAANLHEPWYGTAYSVAPISDELVAACANPPPWEGELRWPEPNPFVPTEFALLCDEVAGKAAEAGNEAVDVAVDVADRTPAVDETAPAAAPAADATRAAGTGATAASATLDAALASRGPLVAPALVHDEPICEIWQKTDRTCVAGSRPLHLWLPSHCLLSAVRADAHPEADGLRLACIGSDGPRRTSSSTS
jgi:secreted Zn-dependent insulinase-like peptidase